MVPGSPSVLMKMATPRRYLDAAHAHSVAGDVYGGAFRRDPELVARTFRHVRFSSRGGYYLQLAAAFGWTSLPWLFLIRQPTLIMAGADDPLVPLINARMMQWLIPDAQLEILDCGHLFLVTLPNESARIVDSFLTERERNEIRHRRMPALVQRGPAVPGQLQGGMRPRRHRFRRRGHQHRLRQGAHGIPDPAPAPLLSPAIPTIQRSRSSWSRPPTFAALDQTSSRASM